MEDRWTKDAHVQEFLKKGAAKDDTGLEDTKGLYYEPEHKYNESYKQDYDETSTPKQTVAPAKTQIKKNGGRIVQARL